MNTSLEGIAETLKNIRGKRSVITFHSHGDLDACGSAIALNSFLPNSVIVAPDYPSYKAMRIIQDLGLFNRIRIFNKNEHQTFENAEAIIFVDMSSYGVSTLGDMLKSLSKPKIVIDHHIEEIDIIEGDSFVDREYVSTSSIIFEIFRKNNFRISPEVAQIIILGMLSDSPNFSTATPLTFLQVSELLKISKKNFFTLKNMLENGASVESKKELLVQMKEKVNYKVFNGYIFGYGIVENYISVSYLANLLMQIGCDFVVVGAKGNEKSRISLRAKVGTKINLSKIAAEYAQKLSGSGGGHSYSAAIYWKETDQSSRIENVLPQVLRDIEGCC